MEMREAATDRISDLPDSILHHINSLLDIKDAACTSVVSKRMDFIFTTVSTLDFRWKEGHRSTSRIDGQNFVAFVDKTFKRRSRNGSPNIHKFFLQRFWNFFDSKVQSWISSVISAGNLNELGVYMPRQNPRIIPPSVFTCESLISLGLQTLPSIQLPSRISFPRLKRLELLNFEVRDDNWNQQLFSNSPVLEELILKDLNVSMEFFSISVPTLKILDIDTGKNKDNGIQDCILTIDAPSLVSFSYTGYASKEFVCSGFLDIVEAVVQFDFEDPEETDGVAVSRCLQSLAYAKRLTLNDKTLQAICYARHQPSNALSFHNVEMLNIVDNLISELGLIILLKAAPGLESLVFAKYMDDNIEYHDVGEESDGDDYSEEEDDGDSTEGEADDGSVEDDGDSTEGEADDGSEDDDGNSTEGNAGDGSEEDAADSMEGDNDRGSEDQVDVSEAAESASDDESEANDDYGYDSWVSIIPDVENLFPHLKSVCFQQFAGNPTEMKWVVLILKNGKAMQKMTTHYYHSEFHFTGAISETEVMAVMPRIPRASSGCVFQFDAE